MVEANVPIRKPMTGTTQIWVVIHHQCGISALVPQTSFHEETSGGIAQSQLCSKALKGPVAKFSHNTCRSTLPCFHSNSMSSGPCLFNDQPHVSNPGAKWSINRKIFAAAKE